jgi:hypothetical protein
MPWYGNKSFEEVASGRKPTVFSLRNQVAQDRMEAQRQPFLSDSGTKAWKGIHAGNKAVLTLNCNTDQNTRNTVHSVHKSLGQRGLYTLQPHPVYGRGFAVEGHQNVPASYHHPAFAAVDVF